MIVMYGCSSYESCRDGLGATESGPGPRKNNAEPARRKREIDLAAPHYRLRTAIAVTGITVSLLFRRAFRPP